MIHIQFTFPSPAQEPNYKTLPPAWPLTDSLVQTRSGRRRGRGGPGRGRRADWWRFSPGARIGREQHSLSPLVSSSSAPAPAPAPQRADQGPGRSGARSGAGSGAGSGPVLGTGFAEPNSSSFRWNARRIGCPAQVRPGRRQRRLRPRTSGPRPSWSGCWGGRRAGRPGRGVAQDRGSSANSRPRPTGQTCSSSLGRSRAVRWAGRGCRAGGSPASCPARHSSQTATTGSRNLRRWSLRVRALRCRGSRAAPASAFPTTDSAAAVGTAVAGRRSPSPARAAASYGGR